MESIDSVVNDKLLTEEYRRLGQQTMPRPRTEAEYFHTHASATLPCNKTKNRYTDVLPVESTRIKLEPRTNEPGSDYINANQVRDPTPAPDGEEVNDYICAQAPLQNTLNDFWRMIWEQDVCMIVILMRLSENGKIKGHRYWPKHSKRTLAFGDITVSLVKSKHFPHRSDDSLDIQREQTTIRVLELKRGNDHRNIVQLHFKDWPDFGVPEATDPIRNLVRIMDFYRTRARAAQIKGPVVIHCSAGIGRTGTYLAIVFALNALKHLKHMEANGLLVPREASQENSHEMLVSSTSDSPSYSDDDSKDDMLGVMKSPSSAPSAPHRMAKDPSSSDMSTTTRDTSTPSTFSSSALSSQASQTTSSTFHRRAGSSGSADSVEYATALIEEETDSSSSSPSSGNTSGDSSDTGDSNGGSFSDASAETSDEEADLMHIQSYLRPGAVIPVDIMKIVLSLRKQRNRGMVQTEDQYKFIYRVVFDEIKSQRLNVTEGVLQFMTDAAHDFTETAPSSGGKLHSSRRKSQPRSPRSTQLSLGSQVSIGSSGLSRLSSSNLSSSATGSSTSWSDEESDHGKIRLKVSGETSGPLLSLDPPDAPFCVPRRNLAMSCANIQPTDSSLSLPGTSGSAEEFGFASGSALSSSPPRASSAAPSSHLPRHRRSIPDTSDLLYSQDS